MLAKRSRFTVFSRMLVTLVAFILYWIVYEISFEAIFTHCIICFAAEYSFTVIPEQKVIKMHSYPHSEGMIITRKGIFGSILYYVLRILKWLLSHVEKLADCDIPLMPVCATLYYVNNVYEHPYFGQIVESVYYVALLWALYTMRKVK